MKVNVCARLAVFAVAAAGCSSDPKPPDPASASVEDKLKAVAKAFGDASSSLNRPPKTMAELRPLIKAIGDPDEILRSPNDGKPFHVNFAAAAAADVVACEQDGANGQRKAVNLRGEVAPLAGDAFARLTAPVPSGPPPRIEPDARNVRHFDSKAVKAVPAAGK